MAQTRKCLFKGVKASRHAKTRRASALKHMKNMQTMVQQWLPKMNILHENAKEKLKEMKHVPPSLRKMFAIAVRATDPKRMRNMMQVSVRINQQYANMPTLPIFLEEQIVKAVEMSHTILNDALKMSVSNQPIPNVQSVNVISTSPTQMPDLFAVSSGCAWESPTPATQKMYKQRIQLLNKTQVLYKDVMQKMQTMQKVGTNTINVNTFQLSLDTLEIWKNVPAGPTVESEKERIVYFTYIYENGKQLLDMAQLFAQMFEEMEKMEKKA
jgi:hypothetical protein